MKVKGYLNEISVCANKLNKQTDVIDKVIDILSDAKLNRQQVFVCGNGGSAGTATHMACDLFKMSGIKAISLDDNVPLMTAIINDNGWENLYEYQLNRLYKIGDVLISISVHGGSGEDKAGKWSQNLSKAIEYVKKNGGLTIGLTGFDGGEMKKICDACIVVPSESTPIVESFHVVLHHLLAFMLQEGDRR